MDGATLIMYFKMDVGLSIAMIAYLIIVLKNKDIIPLVDSVPRKIAKRINVFMKIFLGIYFAYLSIYSFIPAIKDIPYIIERKYETVKGYSASQDTGHTNTSYYLREIIIEDLEKGKVRVKIYTEYIRVGDYLEVNYLPNTHLGTVIKRR